MLFHLRMSIGHAPFHKTRDLIGALYIIHQSHTLFHGKGRGLLTFSEGTAHSHLCWTHDASATEERKQKERTT